MCWPAWLNILIKQFLSTSSLCDLLPEFKEGALLFLPQQIGQNFVLTWHRGFEEEPRKSLYQMITC